MSEENSGYADIEYYWHDPSSAVKWRARGRWVDPVTKLEYLAPGDYGPTTPTKVVWYLTLSTRRKMLLKLIVKLLDRK